MKKALSIVGVGMLLALGTSTSGATVIDAGFVVGPNNGAPSMNFIAFTNNASNSFSNNFQSKGGTVEGSPQAYNPLFDNDVITTDRMLSRDNSWLGVDDPASPFDGESGNFVWSFARIRANGDSLTLSDLRYERDVQGSTRAEGFESSGSYESSGYEDTLSGSRIGIDYGDDGDDGAYGGDDDTFYTTGNGSTLVDEIRIYSDFGFALDVDGELPALSDQAQLDAAILELDAETPFTVSNEFSLVDTDITGGSTITVNRTTTVPEPASALLALAGMSLLAAGRGCRRSYRTHEI